MRYSYVIHLVMVFLIILAGCSDPAGDEDRTGEDNDGHDTSLEKKEQGDEEPSAGEASEGSGENDGLITVEEPASTNVVVNKSRKLPDGYTPPDLVVPDVAFYFDEFHPKKQMRKEAARELESLFQGAKEAGVDLVAASGYRSYERQKKIYQDNVDKRGKEEANKVSAQPGTSEHQTGLAMDVSSAEVAFKLVEDFNQTEEGAWLEQNAYRYGFVIRYPEGKTEITGYSYEPWHLRYVGRDVAADIHEQNETLEEYFGFYPKE
ncbi:D-alanyl-D-alanine carboxypeptidase family protein [Thalassobacillus sp. CUG 92003]|uniref:M15 family metallopeptidase n=1 Tax=Thalassobacillus sp. CUG 92003 TaxID=2736641 RepID=UPI0015E77BF9|nr:M15 family metallopeptidase [Thalassobacillus sp. CUG 92003]